jgi:hypothetical protein
MNRAAAMDYLKNEYEDLSTEANFDADKELRAYSTAIDQALRQLDVPEANLVTADIAEGDIVSYLALLDYFALTRFARVFSIRTDVSVSGAISTSQSQAFKQVLMLRDNAEKRLAGLGLSPSETITAGRFTLDFLEPDLLSTGMG